MTLAELVLHRYDHPHDWCLDGIKMSEDKRYLTISYVFHWGEWRVTLKDVYNPFYFNPVDVDFVILTRIAFLNKPDDYPMQYKGLIVEKKEGTKWVKKLVQRNL